jgi:hypothetical protein
MSIPQRDQLVTVTTGDLFDAYRTLAAYHVKIADRMIRAGENGNARMSAAIRARAAVAQSLAAVAELYRSGA